MAGPTPSSLNPRHGNCLPANAPWSSRATAANADAWSSSSKGGGSIKVTANPLQGLALLWEATQTGQPIDLVLFGPHGHRIPAEQFASLVRCESA